MKSTLIQKEPIEKQEQNGQAPRNYNKPTLIKLGAVTELTTGGSGTQIDCTNPAAPGKETTCG